MFILNMIYGQLYDMTCVLRLLELCDEDWIPNMLAKSWALWLAWHLAQQAIRNTQASQTMNPQVWMLAIECHSSCGLMTSQCEYVSVQTDADINMLSLIPIYLSQYDVVVVLHPIVLQPNLVKGLKSTPRERLNATQVEALVQGHLGWARLALLWIFQQRRKWTETFFLLIFLFGFVSVGVSTNTNLMMKQQASFGWFSDAPKPQDLDFKCSRF